MRSSNVTPIHTGNSFQFLEQGGIVVNMRETWETNKGGGNNEGGGDSGSDNEYNSLLECRGINRFSIGIVSLLETKIKATNLIR